ncbi:MAG: GNAT family N-acetyltransferase [Legionellales bacterium]|nr:GNAT family N-acetyltransferase [Legionellales bacterium]
MSNEKLCIECLDEHHDRRFFSCGIDALDRYLITEATQYRKRDIAITYVLTVEHSDVVIGYYALSSTSISLDALPGDISKKLPRHPHVPAILLGRLAVNTEHQKKKYGEILLINALQKSFESSQTISAVAVTVDAENDMAVKFYKKYGFIEFPERKNKLFLPMKTIVKLLSQME